MSTLEPAKSSEERGPLQLQKTKDGYSVTRGGRTFAKQPEFAEAVAKVWKNVSSNAGDEKKKNRHFYRLVELALSLEEAQLSGLPVTEDEARTLESARKTTIVTALHMLSDKNEKINFTEIQKDIGSRVDAIRSKDTKAKLAEVHRLSQLASLLCDAVHTGAFSGDEEQAVQALATASLAIAEAGTVLSPLRKRFQLLLTKSWVVSRQS